MKDGMSPTAIKKKYRHNHPFIYRSWKRYQETGGTPRPGRPKSLPMNQRKEVRRLFKRRATSSLRGVAKKMRTEHGESVTKSTIAKIAHAEGLVQ